MSLNLEVFRQKLLERRAELLREDEIAADDRAPVELDQSKVGRLSRMDALQSQAMAMAQQRRREAGRAALDAALKRIDDDEYGYCLSCGKDITIGRLMSAPAATFCIDCASDV